LFADGNRIATHAQAIGDMVDEIHPFRDFIYVGRQWFGQRRRAVIGGQAAGLWAAHDIDPPF